MICHRTKLDVPLYYGYFNIVFTDDLMAVSDKYKLGLDKICGAFVYGRRHKVTQIPEYWVVFSIKHLTHRTIAHEVVHVVNWIFLDKDIKHDILNDEPQAYLSGWVSSMIYKATYKNNVEIIA